MKMKTENYKLTSSRSRKLQHNPRWTHYKTSFLQNELSTKKKLQACDQKKSKELEEIALRVRQTVAKKDTIIQGLQQQLAESELSIQELQQL